MFTGKRPFTGLKFYPRKFVLNTELDQLQEILNYRLNAVKDSIRIRSGVLEGSFSPFEPSGYAGAIENSGGFAIIQKEIFMLSGTDNRPSPAYDEVKNVFLLPAAGTAERDDLVFVEFSYSSLTGASTINKYGNLLAEEIPNDIVDPTLGSQTTTRSAFTYKMRVAEASSLSGVNSEAGMPFVQDTEDSNLYADGTGVYAIPLCSVHRLAGDSSISGAQITNVAPVSFGGGGSVVASDVLIDAISGMTSSQVQEALEEIWNVVTGIGSPSVNAEDVYYDISGTSFVSDNVQQVLNEIDTILAGLSYSASDISYDNAGSGLTAGNTQEAIDEVNEKVENIQSEDVSYDNATSALSATDAQAAIDEVNEKVDNMPAVEVSYDNTSSGITATEVQGAIDEAISIAGSGGGGVTLPIDASDVNYDNAGSALTSTDVQDALDELSSSIGGGGMSLPITASDVTFDNADIDLDSGVVQDALVELREKSFNVYKKGARRKVFPGMIPETVSSTHSIDAYRSNYYPIIDIFGGNIAVACSHFKKDGGTVGATSPVPLDIEHTAFYLEDNDGVKTYLELDTGDPLDRHSTPNIKFLSASRIATAYSSNHENSAGFHIYVDVYDTPFTTVGSRVKMDILDTSLGSNAVCCFPEIVPVSDSEFFVVWAQNNTYDTDVTDFRLFMDKVSWDGSDWSTTGVPFEFTSTSMNISIFNHSTGVFRRDIFKVGSEGDNIVATWMEGSSAIRYLRFNTSTSTPIESAPVEVYSGTGIEGVSVLLEDNSMKVVFPVQSTKPLALYGTSYLDNTLIVRNLYDLSLNVSGTISFTEKVLDTGASNGIISLHPAFIKLSEDEYFLVAKKSDSLEFDPFNPYSFEVNYMHIDPVTNSIEIHPNKSFNLMSSMDEDLLPFSISTSDRVDFLGEPAIFVLYLSSRDTGSGRPWETYYDVSYRVYTVDKGV